MGRQVLTIVLLAWSARAVQAQDGPRALTVLDQVEDPAERRAFQELYRKTDPIARRTNVSNFLRRYPDSWLLAQVYEAGARASFDLGDYPTGVFYARQSLQLYPENPLLTGTLAAVHANRGEKAAARARARETLEYLERFRTPEGIKEADGREVRDRLRRTAAQVLGERPADRATLPKDARAGYAGADACRKCHSGQWDAWKATGMAKMLRPVEPANVIGQFAKLSQAGEPARGFFEGGNFFIDLQRAGGLWDRFRVDYTIGSKWQQGYATKAPNGELHVLPIQYNRLTKSWINYWRMIDPPKSPRSEAGDFHKLREVTSYQKNCATCHTSQPDERGFLEAGVNCEMCHGPSAAHARGAPAPFRFKSIDHRGYVEVCAQCHAQSAVREPQGFPPRYQRRPYAEFSRKAFYRDGRFRETTFIVEAFERSACFRKGEAHCGHCHNPHPDNAATNLVSLKFAPDSNEMCLQCHASGYATISHTRHAPGEGNRCVDCHMPKIMNSLLFAARTHQIDDRPRAESTLRFGPKESPNACLGCHGDRDGKWLTENLRQWRGLPRKQE